MDNFKITRLFNIVGIDVKIVDLNLDLPILYLNKYELAKLSLGEKAFLLIKEKREGSLETLVDQAKYLKERTKLDFILVFTQCSEEKKRDLLYARIPFMDYKKNFFIPEMGILLQPSRQYLKKSQFVPSEQLVLIQLLLLKGTEIDVSQLQKMTSLSVPTIYRVLKNFIKREWVASTRQNYIFAKNREQIFKEAEAYFFNPIKRSVYLDIEMVDKIRWALKKLNQEEWKVSNITALSNISRLANNESYYAVSKQVFNRLEKESGIRYIKDRISAWTVLEIWEYEPSSFDYIWNGWKNKLVSWDEEKVIDPISLYLSLKEEEDDRIADEVEELKEKIIGYLGELDARKF